MIKLDINTTKDQQKAMALVITNIEGVDLIKFDMGSKTLTVIGDIDPDMVSSKLKKNWTPEIIHVSGYESPLSCAII
ncbi:hypothetical protein LIER_41562 [Lithospermum erythrorhizon]|uniref:HMA domain-containing protein n=1 Tax=Lithospermum erythrorhizon TaxID=34254 RepID=A0AAV3RCG9_LITER